MTFLEKNMSNFAKNEKTSLKDLQEMFHPNNNTDSYGIEVLTEILRAKLSSFLSFVSKYRELHRKPTSIEKTIGDIFERYYQDLSNPHRGSQAGIVIKSKLSPILNHMQDLFAQIEKMNADNLKTTVLDYVKEMNNTIFLYQHLDQQLTSTAAYGR